MLAVATLAAGIVSTLPTSVPPVAVMPAGAPVKVITTSVSVSDPSASVIGADSDSAIVTGASVSVPETSLAVTDTSPSPHRHPEAVGQARSFIAVGYRRGGEAAGIVGRNRD